jgi:uncharacterized protein
MESPCIACAARGDSCCCGVQVYLTAEDVKRIAGFLGIETFWSYEQPDADYTICEEEPEWPSYVTRSDGTRRTVKRTSTFDCVLLTANGCKLPLHLRPLLCRLHPYLFSRDALLGISPGCPVSQLSDQDELLTAMQMDYESVEHWRKLLYEEVDEERSAVELTYNPQVTATELSANVG